MRFWHDKLIGCPVNLNYPDRAVNSYAPTPQKTTKKLVLTKHKYPVKGYKIRLERHRTRVMCQRYQGIKG